MVKTSRLHSVERDVLRLAHQTNQTEIKQMKVFLDDLRPTPDDWVRVYTSHELIKLFKQEARNITHMSLDHDLGEDTATGYDFMRWLEGEVFAGRVNRIPKIQFHTANPIGRKNMEQALQNISNILGKRKEQMTEKMIKFAKETMDAVKAQKYKTPSGRTLSLDKLVTAAVRRSVLYKPGEPEFGDLEEIAAEGSNTTSVTQESTLEAAWRLKDEKPCVLNFASAKNPGGGFLRGSVAQEESIARASALYHTLIVHPEYYEENKRSQAKNIGAYTDHAIYSPDIPVLRNDRGDWLEEPYTTSVLTSPAPNRSAMMDDAPMDLGEYRNTIDEAVEFVFRKRMKQVLRIMAKHGHRTLILGGWGCGVFGNDPEKVAEWFEEALKEHPYFDNIVFAIYDRPESDVMRAFTERFNR